MGVGGKTGEPGVRTVLIAVKARRNSPVSRSMAEATVCGWVHQILRLPRIVTTTATLERNDGRLPVEARLREPGNWRRQLTSVDRAKILAGVWP